MLSGGEVKKRIGEERKEVRRERGRSVGMNIERRRDPSEGRNMKKCAFVASSQVSTQGGEGRRGWNDIVG